MVLNRESLDFWGANKYIYTEETHILLKLYDSLMMVL